MTPPLRRSNESPTALGFDIARIAAVIMESCHGVWMDDATTAADAVIRELGGRECADCGRRGTQQFIRDGKDWVCRSTQQCKRRKATR